MLMEDVEASSISRMLIKDAQASSIQRTRPQASSACRTRARERLPLRTVREHSPRAQSESILRTLQEIGQILDCGFYLPVSMCWNAKVLPLQSFPANRFLEVKRPILARVSPWRMMLLAPTLQRTTRNQPQSTRRFDLECIILAKKINLSLLRFRIGQRLII